MDWIQRLLKDPVTSEYYYLWEAEYENEDGDLIGVVTVENPYRTEF